MINPWTQGRIPGKPPHPPLGAWQVKRKLASAAWVPPQWAREAIAGTHLFWYQFPALTLTPGQTDLTRVTVSEDFWMIAVLAHASDTLAGGAGSFRFMVYEESGAYKHSKYALDQLAATSNGKEPGLIRMPHFIAAGSPVNCRIQNLDGSNSNTVRLSLFGYSNWWRQ